MEQKKDDHIEIVAGQADQDSTKQKKSSVSRLGGLKTKNKLKLEMDKPDTIRTPHYLSHILLNEELCFFWTKFFRDRECVAWSIVGTKLLQYFSTSVSAGGRLSRAEIDLLFGTKSNNLLRSFFDMVDLESTGYISLYQLALVTNGVGSADVVQHMPLKLLIFLVAHSGGKVVLPHWTPRDQEVQTLQHLLHCFQSSVSAMAVEDAAEFELSGTDPCVAERALREVQAAVLRFSPHAGAADALEGKSTQRQLEEALSAARSAARGGWMVVAGPPLQGTSTRLLNAVKELLHKSLVRWHGLCREACLLGGDAVVWDSVKPDTPLQSGAVQTGPPKVGHASVFTYADITNGLVNFSGLFDAVYLDLRGRNTKPEILGAFNAQLALRGSTSLMDLEGYFLKFLRSLRPNSIFIFDHVQYYACVILRKLLNSVLSATSLCCVLVPAIRSPTTFFGAKELSSVSKGAGTALGLEGLMRAPPDARKSVGGDTTAPVVEVRGFMVELEKFLTLLHVDLPCVRESFLHSGVAQDPGLWVIDGSVPTSQQIHMPPNLFLLLQPLKHSQTRTLADKLLRRELSSTEKQPRSERREKGVEAEHGYLDDDPAPPAQWSSEQQRRLDLIVRLSAGIPGLLTLLVRQEASALEYLEKVLGDTQKAQRYYDSLPKYLSTANTLNPFPNNFSPKKGPGAQLLDAISTICSQLLHFESPALGEDERLLLASLLPPIQAMVHCGPRETATSFAGRDSGGGVSGCLLIDAKLCWHLSKPFFTYVIRKEGHPVRAEVQREGVSQGEKESNEDLARLQKRWLAAWQRLLQLGWLVDTTHTTSHERQTRKDRPASWPETLLTTHMLSVGKPMRSSSFRVAEFAVAALTSGSLGSYRHELSLLLPPADLQSSQDSNEPQESGRPGDLNPLPSVEEQQTSYWRYVAKWFAGINARLYEVEQLLDVSEDVAVFRTAALLSSRRQLTVQTQVDPLLLPHLTMLSAMVVGKLSTGEVSRIGRGQNHTPLRERKNSDMSVDSMISPSVDPISVDKSILHSYSSDMTVGSTRSEDKLFDNDAQMHRRLEEEIQLNAQKSADSGEDLGSGSSFSSSGSSECITPSTGPSGTDTRGRVLQLQALHNNPSLTQKALVESTGPATEDTPKRKHPFEQVQYFSTDLAQEVLRMWGGAAGGRFRCLALMRLSKRVATALAHLMIQQLGPSAPSATLRTHRFYTLLDLGEVFFALALAETKAPMPRSSSPALPPPRKVNGVVEPLHETLLRYGVDLLQQAWGLAQADGSGSDDPTGGTQAMAQKLYCLSVEECVLRKCQVMRVLLRALLLQQLLPSTGSQLSPLEQLRFMLSSGYSSLIYVNHAKDVLIRLDEFWLASLSYLGVDVEEFLSPSVAPLVQTQRDHDQNNRKLREVLKQQHSDDQSPDAAAWAAEEAGKGLYGAAALEKLDSLVGEQFDPAGPRVSRGPFDEAVRAALTRLLYCRVVTEKFRADASLLLAEVSVQRLFRVKSLYRLFEKQLWRQALSEEEVAQLGLQSPIRSKTPFTAEEASKEESGTPVSVKSSERTAGDVAEEEKKSESGEKELSTEEEQAMEDEEAEAEATFLKTIARVQRFFQLPLFSAANGQLDLTTEIFSLEALDFPGPERHASALVDRSVFGRPTSTTTLSLQSSAYVDSLEKGASESTQGPVERWFERSIASAQELFGPVSTHTASVRVLYANYLSSTGVVTDALIQFELAHEAFKSLRFRNFNRPLPVLVHGWLGLANCREVDSLAGTGAQDVAVKNPLQKNPLHSTLIGMYHEAWVTYRSVFGEQHYCTVQAAECLAPLLQLEQRWKEQVKLLQSTLPALRATERSILRTRKALLNQDADPGKHDPLAHRLVEARLHAVHLRLISMLQMQAQALTELKQYQAAIPLYKEVVLIQKALFRQALRDSAQDQEDFEGVDLVRDQQTTVEGSSRVDYSEEVSSATMYIAGTLQLLASCICEVGRAQLREAGGTEDASAALSACLDVPSSSMTDLHYQQAVRILSQAVQMYADLNDLPSTIAPLMQARKQLAAVHLSQGHKELAKECYEQTMQLFMEVKVDYREIAKTHTEYSRILVRLGEFSEAALLFQHAVEIYQKLLNPKPAKTSNKPNSDPPLSIEAAGAPDRKPEPTEGTQEIMGPETEELQGRMELQELIATNLMEKGGALLDLGVHDEAQEALTQAFHAFRKCYSRQDFDKSKLVATCLGHLAAVHHHFEEFSVAEEYYQKSVDIYVQAGMGLSAEIANIYNNFAALLDDKGQLDKAKELYEFAIVILFQRHGHAHAQIFATLENLLNLLQHMGLEEEATNVTDYLEQMSVRVGEAADLEKARRETLNRSVLQSAVADGRERRHQREKLLKVSSAEESEKGKEKKDRVRQTAGPSNTTGIFSSPERKTPGTLDLRQHTPLIIIHAGEDEDLFAPDWDVDPRDLDTRGPEDADEGFELELDPADFMERNFRGPPLGSGAKGGPAAQNQYLRGLEQRDVGSIEEGWRYENVEEEENNTLYMPVGDKHQDQEEPASGNCTVS